MMASAREAKTDEKKKAILVGIDFDNTFVFEEETRNFNTMAYTGLSKERWIAFFKAIEILAEKNNMEALLCGITFRVPHHFLTKKSGAEEEKYHSKIADEAIRKALTLAQKLKLNTNQLKPQATQFLKCRSIQEAAVITQVRLDSPVIYNDLKDYLFRGTQEGDTPKPIANLPSLFKLGNTYFADFPKSYCLKYLQNSLSSTYTIKNNNVFMLDDKNEVAVDAIKAGYEGILVNPDVYGKDPLTSIKATADWMLETLNRIKFTIMPENEDSLETLLGKELLDMIKKTEIQWNPVKMPNNALEKISILVKQQIQASLALAKPSTTPATLFSPSPPSLQPPIPPPPPEPPSP